MNRLIRIADLQSLSIVAYLLLALPQGGLPLPGGALLGLDLVILVLALWLKRAPTHHLAAGGFWGPWPARWVPARFLGGTLALLNLAGAAKGLEACGLMAGAASWLAVSIHAAFLLLFLWACRRPQEDGDDSRSWLAAGWPHLATAGAALACLWGAAEMGLSPFVAVTGGLALAAGLGALWSQGVRRPVEESPAAQLDPAWLKTVRDGAAQEERNRLARDLHDSIKQQLFTIQVAAATVRARWELDPEGARGALGQVERAVREAMAEARALLQQLRPQALEGSGLVEALREQCEALGFRTGSRVQFELGASVPDERLPFDTAETLFRIAQEALSNVARHARPERVTVFLGRRIDDLVLEVNDDGQGFDPAKSATGMGLRNLKERGAHLGADLRLASRPGAGTTLTVRVPLRPVDETAVPASPARAWLSETLTKNQGGMGSFLFVLTILGAFLVQITGQGDEPTTGAGVAALAAFYAAVWMAHRRDTRQQRQKAEAWQPELSRRDLASLHSSHLRTHVLADHFGLWMILAQVGLPPRPSPYFLGTLLALFGAGSLVLSLYRFHRESEAGGWIYSFQRWLRRPQGIPLWLPFAVVVAIPNLRRLQSLLAALTPPAWIALAFWALFALYLGLRRQKRFE